MVEVTYYGVDTGLFEGGEDLVGRILENVADPPGLEDGDVIVRGLEYDSGDGIEPDAEFLRDAIVPTLVQSIRVKLAERVPVF